MDNKHEKFKEYVIDELNKEIEWANNRIKVNGYKQRAFDFCCDAFSRGDFSNLKLWGEFCTSYQRMLGDMTTEGILESLLSLFQSWDDEEEAGGKDIE